MAEGLGRREIGPYVLQEVIGSGGMGLVWRAIDTSRGDVQVAIKVVADGLVEDPVYQGRFKREAEIASSLKHPFILPVLDYGRDTDVLYMVMPLITTGTLSDVLRRSTCLTPRQTQRVASQVGMALDYAHQRHIIHRDVKPDNIMIVNKGRVCLSDFGLSRLAGVDTISGPGSVLGSPSYMSPEQARGAALDCRSDIYSFGIVLYQCLVGRLPYRPGNIMEIMGQHVNAEPLAPHAVNRDFPAALESVILRALEKEPERRYATAGLFAAAVMDAVNALPEAQQDAPQATLDQIVASRVGAEDSLMKLLASTTTGRAMRWQLAGGTAIP